MKGISRNVQEAREAYKKGDVEMIKNAHNKIGTNIVSIKKEINSEVMDNEDKHKHAEAHSEAGGFIKSALQLLLAWF